MPEGNRIVLYSGTFEPYQGLPLLLDALPRVQARVPTVTFVLVGATDDAVAGLGRQHAAAIAAGALRIVARQPRAEVPTFLAAADLLVSTRSVGHNLPLKIFDYLAAGRPIVATDIPAHRAVLDDRCAVLVQPTAGAIAAAIVDLLHDPQRAARLAREGQARGAARHGWASFVESVAELYARVLSSGPGVLRNGRRGPVPLRVNGAR